LRYNNLLIVVLLFSVSLSPALFLLAEPASGNSLSIDGQYVIDSIVINNNNIFDTEKPRYAEWPYKFANRVHVKTRRSVISRELLLGEGEIYSTELARETERNLRALPYIWSADVSLDTTSDERNIMRVTTWDRWTLLGGPTISRNAGQNIYELGVEELNFLGYGQQLLFNYYIREYEENYADFSFLERRLFGSRHMLGIVHWGHPEVGADNIFISRPFFSLNARYSYEVSFFNIDRTDYYYQSGIVIARNRFQERLFSLSLGYRFGSYDSKVTYSLDYSYRDINVSDRRILPEVDFIFPSDSVYHFISPGISIGTYDFIETHRINRFRKVEDFPVAKSAGLSMGWALNASDGSRIYRTITLSGNFGKYFSSNLIFIDFSKTFWFEGRRDFRQSTDFSIRYYNNALTWLTAAAGVDYIMDRRIDKQGLLYLGENSGIRGYPKNYSNGERVLKTNLEARVFTGLTFFTTELGLVGFFDFGQVVPEGTKLAFEDNLWSAGAGLRLANEMISSAEIFRIDLAYAGKLREWELSFGLGQYF
jgi:hypothetical protein